MVNNATLVGNLGGDPQVRTLPSGQNVANFSVATTAMVTNRSTGEREKRTEWHRVVVYGKLADNCASYLRKGRQVYVDGRLQTRQFEAKDGSGRRERTELVARQVRFLGRRNDAAQAAGEEVPF